MATASETTEERKSDETNLNNLTDQTEWLTIDDETRDDPEEHKKDKKPDKEDQHDQTEKLSEKPAPLPSAIDLGDPNQVVQLLETVNLSEEDTEVLLQEAYKMNKKLKEVLRRQEEGEALKGAVITEQAPGKFVISSAPPRRKGSGSLTKSRPLPPIGGDHVPSDIYGTKFQRSRTHLEHSTLRSNPRKANNKTPDSTDSKKGNQKSHKERKNDRPEWNGRFAYT